jgi:hypothetical protein
MRTCIFCDDPATTKEHAWPQWLLRLFPSNDRSVIEAERAGRSLGTWHATGGIQLRFVCLICNTGWMSALENSAKPIIRSLLEGDHVHFDAASQAILSAWALKTAMVFEALNPDRPRFYTNKERGHMRSLQAMAHRTSVWIARCIEQPDLYCAGKVLSGPFAEGEIGGYATTLGIGPIALQILTVRPPASTADDVRLIIDTTEGPWGDTVTALWPPSLEGLSWRPTHALTGEIGIEALTERFGLSRRPAA